MIIINRQSLSNCRQRSVSSIEECVSTSIILWSDPFSFHHPPQGFGNIQMRGIGRQIEKKKSPFFPYWTHFFHLFTSMNSGVIKYNKCLFYESEGKAIEKADNLPAINRLIGRKSFKMIISAGHSEDIKSFGSPGRNIKILPCKLPAIRNISFCADMGFIAIEKANFSLAVKPFKFLQLLCFILIELRRGYSPWTFPYTSISCANVDKKRLNVSSLASFPEAFCHASLAARTLWRSDSMATRTASSSEQSMIGLRPCPGRVYRPFKPSNSNRFTHPFTLWAVISVCSPTCLELRHSDLRRIARQRIRNTWDSPCRKPVASCIRCESVNVKFLIFIFTFLYKMQRSEIYYM